jgi:uncharacterized protein YndB with AHSA1/START domain
MRRALRQSARGSPEAERGHSAWSTAVGHGAKRFCRSISHAPKIDFCIGGRGKEMKVEKSIDIAAPPEKIWPFFTNPEKVKQWSITFKKFEYSGDRKRGVGTPIYIEEKAAGPLMKMDFEITEWEENERIRLQMTSKGLVKFYEQLWTLTPTDKGTEFTFYEEIVFPLGVIGKLIGLVGQGSSCRTVTEMQARLKTLVEA